MRFEILVSRRRLGPISQRWPNPCAALIVALLLTPFANEVGANDTDTSQHSDQSVLSFLIGEPTLQQNAAQVCLSAGELPVEQQFELLTQWVLPIDGHSFRIVGDFRRPESAARQCEVVDESVRDLREFPESTWILSPARHLVEVATKLGRLEELKRRIQSCKVSQPDEVAAQTTLLTLVEIAEDDFNAVAKRLEDRFAWQRDTQNSGTAGQRWPDLLVLWSAAENPMTAQLITGELFSVYPDLQIQDEYLDLDLVNDYLRLLQSRCQDAALRSRKDPLSNTVAEKIQQWEVFSRNDALTHAKARPLARFHVGSDGSHKITGHELDYLAYRSPMTGDFEVNCEVATRPGAFTELMVHGTAARPIDNGRRISLGGFAKGNWDFVVEPPLEEVESSSHARVVVRDGFATHFYNGRPVHESAVSRSSAPWVALRNWRRTSSEITNVHLVGPATIPESIDMLADTSLDGWASYYDPGTNRGLGAWNASMDADRCVDLVSDVVAGDRGSFDEDLLFYVRPITWDARIRYEFLYDPGKNEVHPAIGRKVLLIRSDGVGLHRLTDGKYQSSTLRSDNAQQLLSTNSAASVKPNLKQGWNEVELQVLGDTVSLELNGQQIAVMELAHFDSRTFGLFRYRDQTQAVVRRLRLTGSWSKSLPPIDKQTLASSAVVSFDLEAEELPIKFVHDFRAGTPPSLFDFEGDETSIERVPDGIRMGRNENTGVHSMRVCAMIDGDFDIIAGYRDLEISGGKPTWHCGVGLQVNLDNPTRDRCAINRRRDRMQGHQYVGFGQQEFNADGKARYIGGANIVDESTAGKLRLVRRGSKIYGLHAIGDSPSFRVVASADVHPGRVAIQGLRFITDIGKGLETNVTWTQLEIRAEGIQFLTVKDQHASLAMLEEKRKQLAVTRIDLTQQSLGDAAIYATTSEHGDVTSDSRGANATIQSDDSTQRMGLIKSLSMGSAFDIEVEFQIMRFDQADRMGVFNEVVLQVPLSELADVDPNRNGLHYHEATIMLRHKANGKIDLIPRVVGRDNSGSVVYLPIRTIPVTMPDLFRISLHSQTLYFVYSEQGSPESKIIATYPLPSPLNASAIHLWINASPNQNVVSTCWKNIQLYGSSPQIQGLFQFVPIQPSQR